MLIRTSILGKSALKRGRDDGITLIELLVALAIVGVIFGVAASGLRHVFNTELKSSSRELGSLIRYLRTKAVTENKYVRLLLDLEQQKYSVEESQEPFLISVPSEEDLKKEKEEEKKEEEEGGEPKPESTFTEAEGLLVKPRRLASGAYFKDVKISYIPGKQETGKVSLYFFPDGYATPALINFRDEGDEDHYSLEVFPYNGKVRIEGRYREGNEE